MLNVLIIEFGKMMHIGRQNSLKRSSQSRKTISNPTLRTTPDSRRSSLGNVFRKIARKISNFFKSFGKRNVGQKNSRNLDRYLSKNVENRSVGFERSEKNIGDQMTLQSTSQSNLDPESPKETLTNNDSTNQSTIDSTKSLSNPNAMESKHQIEDLVQEPNQSDLEKGFNDLKRKTKSMKKTIQLLEEFKKIRSPTKKDKLKILCQLSWKSRRKGNKQFRQICRDISHQMISEMVDEDLKGTTQKNIPENITISQFRKGLSVVYLTEKKLGSDKSDQLLEALDQNPSAWTLLSEKGEKNELKAFSRNEGALTKLCSSVETYKPATSPDRLNSFDAFMEEFYKFKEQVNDRPNHETQRKDDSEMKTVSDQRQEKIQSKFKDLQSKLNQLTDNYETAIDQVKITDQNQTSACKKLVQMKEELKVAQGLLQSLSDMDDTGMGSMFILNAMIRFNKKCNEPLNLKFDEIKTPVLKEQLPELFGNTKGRQNLAKQVVWAYSSGEGVGGMFYEMSNHIQRADGPIQEETGYGSKDFFQNQLTKMENWTAKGLDNNKESFTKKVNSKMKPMTQLNFQNLSTGDVVHYKPKGRKSKACRVVSKTPQTITLEKIVRLNTDEADLKAETHKDQKSRLIEVELDSSKNQTLEALVEERKTHKNPLNTTLKIKSGTLSIRERNYKNADHMSKMSNPLQEVSNLNQNMRLALRSLSEESGPVFKRGAKLFRGGGEFMFKELVTASNENKPYTFKGSTSTSTSVNTALIFSKEAKNEGKVIIFNLEPETTDKESGNIVHKFSKKDSAYGIRESEVLGAHGMTVTDIQQEESGNISCTLKLPQRYFKE